MNRFLIPNSEGFERPARVYARLAQVEEDEKDDRGDVLQFAAVDADWSDHRWSDHRAEDLKSLHVFDDAPISVVEIRRDQAERAGFTVREDQVAEEDAWVQITFGGNGEEIEHFLNLFADPLIRRLSGIGRIPRALLQRLTIITSLNGVRAASRTEIQDALDVSGSLEAVAVYDVGQGNCNAVVDGAFRPLLYFDIGGGVLHNHRTFPSVLSQFCFTASPTIVLSHWDWDHWSSAARDPRATHATWIVPDQQLDPVHAAMASQILANGTLLIWPAGLPSVSFSSLEIRKCTGKPRNHDGLALLVSDPAGDGAQILLTGDARYTAIPGALGPNYAGLVASHHGGRMSSRRVPGRATTGTERVAYSYGVPNSYGHVLPATRANHQAGGWTAELETTATMVPRPAHCALGWTALTPGLTPCGGATASSGSA